MIDDTKPRLLDEKPVVTLDHLARFEAESRRAFARGLYERHIPNDPRTRYPNAVLLNHVRSAR